MEMGCEILKIFNLRLLYYLMSKSSLFALSTMLLMKARSY